MRLTDLLLLWLGALVIVALAGMPPARADDCLDAGEVATMIEDADGYIFDLVRLPGAGFDQVLFFALGGDILMTFMRQGCAVLGPLRLAPAAKVAGT